MRILLLRIALIVAAVAVLAEPIEAQRRGRGRANRSSAPAKPRAEVGGHFGYNFDFDQTVVGAQIALPFGKSIEFYPSADYYTGSGSPDWAVNADLRLRPPRVSQAWYMGGGVNLLFSGSDNRTNANVFGGLESREGAIRPYFELRWIIGDGTALQLVGGLNFGMK